MRRHTRNSTINRGGSRQRIIGAGVIAGCLVSLGLAAAPKVSVVTPNPTNWIVNGSMLTSVTLNFDMPVTIPGGAITARKVFDMGGGDAAVQTVPVTLNSAPNAPTTTVTVTFAPVWDSRMTLVVDYTIENALGEALDGEVANPRSPALPTGDGQQGGQVVLQFSVLQGEISGAGGMKDGFVNATDSQVLQTSMDSCLGGTNYSAAMDTNGDGCVICTENPAIATCAPSPLYRADADLDADGCVDCADQVIHVGGLGHFIPVSDADAPIVTMTTPGDLPFPGNTLLVNFSEMVDPASITRTTIHAVGVNGELIVPTNVTPVDIDFEQYAFTIDGFGCPQNYTFKTSNGVGDGTGHILPAGSPQSQFTRFADVDDVGAPTIQCPPVTYVNSTVVHGIPPEQIPTYAPLQAFLNAATATDACGAASMANNLNTTVMVPLGVTMVTFTATDAAQNSASCATPLIIVPSVPLPGDDGEEGEQGEQGEQGDQGPQGPPGQNGQNGSTGPQGPSGPAGPGGQNGGAGPAGPRGPAGTQGVAGEDGVDGQTGDVGPVGLQGLQGEQGEQGEPADPDAGQDLGGDTPGRGSGACGACGAIGMINGIGLFAGLVFLKLWNRRRMIGE